jgi:hypothetical protein
MATGTIMDTPRKAGSQKKRSTKKLSRAAAPNRAPAGMDKVMGPADRVVPHKRPALNLVPNRGGAMVTEGALAIAEGEATAIVPRARAPDTAVLTGAAAMDRVVDMARASRATVMEQDRNSNGAWKPWRPRAADGNVIARRQLRPKPANPTAAAPRPRRAGQAGAPRGQTPQLPLLRPRRYLQPHRAQAPRFCLRLLPPAHCWRRPRRRRRLPHLRLPALRPSPRHRPHRAYAATHAQAQESAPVRYAGIGRPQNCRSRPDL